MAHRGHDSYVMPNRDKPAAEFKGGDYLYQIEIYNAPSRPIVPRGGGSVNLLLDSIFAAISQPSNTCLTRAIRSSCGA